MLSDEQKRSAVCDSGRGLLETCRLSKGRTDKIIGNANLSEVLRFVRWGWINGNGITPAGRKALEASDA